MISRRKLKTSTNHPLAPKSGFVSQSRLVLYESIGPGPHPCHWCGKPLKWQTGHRRKGDTLLVDHVDCNPSNDALSNLVPSCNSCNTRRTHPHNIKPDELTTPSGNYRTRAKEFICVQCHSRYLRRLAHTKYYGSRFCSHSCQNKYITKESGRGIQDGELFIEKHEKHRIKRLRAVKLVCPICKIEFLKELRFSSGDRYCSISCASIGREQKAPSPRGESSSAAKLTNNLVLAIRADFAANKIGQEQLGQKYGVSRTLIGNIIRGDSWTHV